MALELKLLHEMPPLRENPWGEEQTLDGKRTDFVQRLWQSQTWALQYRDRQIEENVRMLAGQQWMIFSDLLNKWVDISRFLTQDERRWRQRPVINRLLYWFMLTHARMTENPPVTTFLPATGDRFDAILAEVLDTVYKTLWTELGMIEVVDQIMAWLIPGGASYGRSRIDTQRGPMREYRGPALIPWGSDGQRVVEDVPYNAEGVPLIDIHESREGYSFTGDPHRYREGHLEVTVHSPLEIRGEWNNKPWDRKRWHMLRMYLTPEQVYDNWGIEIEPDSTGEEADGAGELQRLLFGAGYFGAAGNKPGVGGFDHGHGEGRVQINEFWHQPSTIHEQMVETQDQPGGRLLVSTKQRVIYDGPRICHLRGASSIHRFDFVNLPGRPHGTSPQEMLNPIQRTYNRGIAQILEHRNLVTNPPMIIDSMSGLEEEQFTNKPGLSIKCMKRPGVKPVEFADPPELSNDVWKIQEMLQDEMDFLGNLEGSEGTPPTRDASGELVKELRFNTDRFLGPTLRRAALTMGRIVEDWIQMLPLVWDEQKIIAYAGEDSVVRTVTVLPEMFERGNVNVAVDIESMLPEGRGERQNRIYRLYADGLLGLPGSPEARKQYFDLARFPHMQRASRPGGVHRTTAEQENGKLAQGVPADQIPILPWYDNTVHLWIHEEFMASPEYLRLAPEIQAEFMQHWQAHKVLHEMQMVREAKMQMMAQGGPPGENGGEPNKNGGSPGSNPGGENPQRGSRPLAQGPPRGENLPRNARGPKMSKKQP